MSPSDEPTLYPSAMTRDNDATMCVHCQQPIVGWAGVPAGPVCHPSGVPGERSSMDCYHLVTVYKHPTPCDCSGALSRLP